MPQQSNYDQVFRLISTTLPDYIKKAEDETIRKMVLPAMLQKRTVFNRPGRFMEWVVYYNDANALTRVPGETVNYTPTDRTKNARLPWAQYIIPEKYTEEEAQRNRGEAAIIDYYDELPERIVKELTKQYNSALYGNGNSSNEPVIFGLETPMGTTGSAIATTAVMDPDGTYAELATDLGQYGGSDPTSAPWPIAQVPVAYDFWSPLILDATSTLASTSDNYAWQNLGGFSERAEEIMSFGINFSNRNVAGQDGELSLYLLNTEWYNAFKMINRAKEKIEIYRGDQLKLTSMGFRDVINFDGAEVTSEYYVPANTAYGVNVNQIQLRCELDRLITSRGPDWDPWSMSWLLSCQLRAQLLLQPKHLVKIGNYGTSGA